MADARHKCMSYNLDPMTLGYHQCMASEPTGRSTR